MKKTILAVGVFATLATSATFAQTATSTGTGTTTPIVASTTQVTCIQNALDKRENSLITAHDTYNTAVKTAITNRLTSLKSAWAQTDKKAKVERRVAAYKAFRTEMQTATTALRNTKNTSWKNFQSDARACGVKATGESASMFTTTNNSL